MTSVKKDKNVNDEKTVVPVKEHLPYKFNDEELKEFSESMARAFQDRSNLIAEKKAVLSKFSANIAGKDAEIEALSLKINSKQEHRYVECEIRMNTPTVGRKTLVRLDSNEIIWDKNMTAEECQLKLSLENKDKVADALVEHSDPDEKE